MPGTSRPPVRAIPFEERLIVGLDVPTLEDARRVAGQLAGTVRFFKVGMWLLFQPGCDALVRELHASGARIFLDHKLYDIPGTVRNGIDSIKRQGARFVTVHGEAAIMAAAVAGAAGSELGVLAVTVLTSMDDAALRAEGYAEDATSLVRRRVKAAAAAGCAGVIASAADHPDALREAGGREDLLVVTPGIRMAGDAAVDQRRVATPREAIRNGADYLVVAGPIVRASDPAVAARRILDDMAAG